MARVSLELFKKHIRTDDYDGDDDYLQHVLDAAEDFVAALTGYTREELSAIPDSEYPTPLIHAVLMRGASMYEYREDVDTSLNATPFSLMAIVTPYRKMNGGSLLEPLVRKYNQTATE